MSVDLALSPEPGRFGRPRTTDLRDVVEALLYISATGCQWRLLPKCFPPYSTVQRFFYRWRADGLWDQINHELVMLVRQAEGRHAGETIGNDPGCSEMMRKTEGAEPTTEDH